MSSRNENRYSTLAYIPPRARDFERHAVYTHAYNNCLWHFNMGTREDREYVFAGLERLWAKRDIDAALKAKVALLIIRGFGDRLDIPVAMDYLNCIHSTFARLTRDGAPERHHEYFFIAFFALRELNKCAGTGQDISDDDFQVARDTLRAIRARSSTNHQNAASHIEEQELAKGDWLRARMWKRMTTEIFRILDDEENQAINGALLSSSEE